ncbi:GNAT family N-acetyltransferase [Phanerochaete sordida]|uniref:GNAT family N-acetyltransferase n=1 Tax=Phanerochaete sordida TaxID=48140 RepID=A0A9P3G7X1_9APHY|nr:GNAT family N-acetyltransferase [Phanerochaete sordida]
MSYPLGLLADGFGEKIDARWESNEASEKLFVAYRGDDLVLALACVDGEPSWSLGAPSSPELTTEDLAAVMSPFVALIATTGDPLSCGSLWGSRVLASAFFDAWLPLLASRGIKAHAAPPVFRAKNSYATRKTLPTSTPTRHMPFAIVPAMQADTDALADLLREFSVVWGAQLSVDDARARMGAHIACGEAWFCRAPDGAALAFCVVGRATPRTIAIKNMYVVPDHRRKGVASALVLGMCRYFLGVSDHGVEGPLVPLKGVKAQVCLNVAEDHVEELYTKCGFLFGDAREPGSDRQPWFLVVGQEVVVEQS